MPFNVTVIYQPTEDSRFDMEYYMNSHMPLVGKHFGKHGLKAWHITEYKKTVEGGKPPVIVEAKLEFDSEESFKTAGEQEGGVVFGDISNFTNIKPTLMVAEIKGSDTNVGA